MFEAKKMAAICKIGSRLQVATTDPKCDATRVKIIMLLQAVNNLFNACSDQDVAMLWVQHSTTQVINLFPVVRTMLFPVVATKSFAPLVFNKKLFTR